MTGETVDQDDPPRAVDLSRGGFPFNTTWTVGDSWKMRGLIDAGCRYEAVAAEFISRTNKGRSFSRTEIAERYFRMVGSTRRVAHADDDQNR